MSKDTRNNIAEEHRGYATKKKRKSVVIPFVLCLLIAIVVWLYASANSEETTTDGKVTTGASRTVAMNEMAEESSAFSI